MKLLNSAESSSGLCVAAPLGAAWLSLVMMVGAFPQTALVDDDKDSNEWQHRGAVYL
jgi:hypothetical protein